MSYLSKFFRIGILIFMITFASVFAAIRRLVIFLKERSVDYFSLSKEYINPFHVDDDDEFPYSCEACPYRHMVDRGYKPVVWTSHKPYILLMLLQYILFIKGHISKADLISFIFNDNSQ